MCACKNDHIHSRYPQKMKLRQRHNYWPLFCAMNRLQPMLVLLAMCLGWLSAVVLAVNLSLCGCIYVLVKGKVSFVSNRWTGRCRSTCLYDNRVNMLIYSYFLWVRCFYCSDRLWVRQCCMWSFTISQHSVTPSLNRTDVFSTDCHNPL